jgi:hypothetical protein
LFLNNFSRHALNLHWTLQCRWLPFHIPCISPSRPNSFSFMHCDVFLLNNCLCDVIEPSAVYCAFMSFHKYQRHGSWNFMWHILKFHARYFI